MYTVCLLDIEDPLLRDRYDELIAGLCDERKCRALSYKMPEDRLRALGSSLLMQDMLWSYSRGSAGEYADGAFKSENVSPGEEVFWKRMTVSDILGEGDRRFRASGAFCADLVFECTDRGKPYVSGYPLYLSISHSGRFCACAVAEREIGLDIQKKSVSDIEKFDRIGERFFDGRESKLLGEAKDDGERIGLFCRLWTVKEAYAKYTGDGIAGALSISPYLDADMYGIGYSIYETDEYCAALCRMRDAE